MSLVDMRGAAAVGFILAVTAGHAYGQANVPTEGVAGNAVTLPPVSERATEGIPISQLPPVSNFSKDVQDPPVSVSRERMLNAAGVSCANPAALGTSRIIRVDTAGGLKVGWKSYQTTFALAPKEVILTFDDGPLPGTTDKILDALRNECVKATFFLVGRNAEAHPQLVRREASDGHTVGHHSWSHPVRTLRGLPYPAALDEVKKGMEADDRAVDPDGPGWPTRTPFFRFPGFADVAALDDWFRDNKVAVFGTDIWASDWALMTPQAQLALIQKRLLAEGGGMILFHDTRSQTAAMLPAFLRWLKSEGFSIVHLVPGAGPTPLKQAPANWTSETEGILRKIMPRLLKMPVGGAKEMELGG